LRVSPDPPLSEDQVQALADRGERRPTAAGDVLVREGEPCQEFYVVLAGEVAVVDEDVDGRRPIAVHGPYRFVGELGTITGEAAFFTAVVRKPGEILAVPAEHLRVVVASDPDLGDLVVRSYLARRDLLITLGAGISIVGSRFSPDARRLREFAARNRVPNRWVDLEDDDHAEQVLQHLGVRPAETPVVIVGDRTILRSPSNAELAETLGLRKPKPAAEAWDLIVVGAGPAGLAASVYAASEGLSTLVLDAVAPGGQAATSPRIENYLGFPSGVSGSDLTERAILQVHKFGADLEVPAQATAIHEDGGRYITRLNEGEELHARALLIATGARYRKLPVPDLERYEGTCVYYAATRVEALMCSGDPVVVVGGGNSAAQASLFLAQHATGVTLLIRHEDVARDMSRYLADRLAQSSVRVCTRTEVCELVGHDDQLEAVVVADRRTGVVRRLDARALFVFIGAEPHTGWLGDLVGLDEHGFVLTGPAAGRTGALETSRPGVFAAGDVRSGSIKRVASAVGEGAMAVRFVHAQFEADAV
jgi:thioredoxin reductase (NADPH)